MAKTKTATVTTRREKPKKRRKGVHAKTKMSKNKGSDLYVKPNVAQGK